MEIDRISPITVMLDEVFYKSSIHDMRSAYFGHLTHVKSWLLLSDYSLEGKKTNNVITFTALPMTADLQELQVLIKRLQPMDIKHSQTIAPGFIDLLHQLPLLTVSFVFDPSKYLAWNKSSEFQEYMVEYCEMLTAYIAFWRQGTPDQERLDRLSKNVRYAQELLRQKKKVRVLCEAFLVSLLGGYVGSLLCRETALTQLCWLSDRDRTNEIGANLVRDLFQITLIDIAKKNISFSFTSANSGSDEWYAELTRIPDILAGTLAGFDFNNSRLHTAKPAAHPVIASYLCNNRSNCFIYRFCVGDEG